MLAAFMDPTHTFHSAPSLDSCSAFVFYTHMLCPVHSQGQMREVHISCVNLSSYRTEHIFPAGKMTVKMVPAC